MAHEPGKTVADVITKEFWPDARYMSPTGYTFWHNQAGLCQEALKLVLLKGAAEAYSFAQSNDQANPYAADAATILADEERLFSLPIPKPVTVTYIRNGTAVTITT